MAGPNDYNINKAGELEAGLGKDELSEQQRLALRNKGAQKMLELKQELEQMGEQLTERERALMEKEEASIARERELIARERELSRREEDLAASKVE